VLRGSGWLIAAAPAVVVLLPAVTATLGPRTGLTVQGIVLGIVTAAALALIASEAGWLDRLKRTPRSLGAGLLLYLVAGTLGAVVGAVRGNPRAYWLGQVLSMGLIPAWAVVGLATRHGFPVRAFSRWLLFSSAGLSVCGLAAWVVGVLRGAEAARVALVPPGVLPLALLIGVVLLLHDRAARGAAWFSVVAVSLAIVGSGGRSLLAVASLSAVTLLALAAPRRRPGPHALIGVAVVGVALAAGVAGARHWWSAARPNQLEAVAGEAGAGTTINTESVVSTAASGGRGLSIALERTTAQQSRTVAEFAPRDAGWYRVSASISGAASGWVYLAVSWHGDSGQRLGTLGGYRGAGRGWERITAAGRRPDAAVRGGVLVTWSEGSGPWEIRSIRVERLESPVLAGLCETARRLFTRPAVVASAEQQTAGTDPSLSFRMSEGTALWSIIRSRGLAETLLGSGLGAEFPFRSFVAGDDDRVTVGERTHYIHNFYMFLLFKLGIAGTAAVLAALALWLAWSVGASRRATAGWERAFCAAAAIAWLGYGAWDLVAPEFLDPHVAPLLGLLLAATAAAGREREPAAPPRPEPTGSRAPA